MIILIIIGLLIFFLVFGVQIYEGYQIAKTGKDMFMKGSEAFSKAQNGEVDYSAIGTEAIKAFW